MIKYTILDNFGAMFEGFMGRPDDGTTFDLAWEELDDKLKYMLGACPRNSIRIFWRFIDEIDETNPIVLKLPNGILSLEIC